ncbi:MAG: YdcH family protein [Gammaproteobacteria bacterium]
MGTPLEPEKHRALRRRLELLSAEHRALDEEINALAGTPYVDQLGLRRLKKHKLQLREEIERIKSALIPDLNA